MCKKKNKRASLAMKSSPRSSFTPSATEEGATTTGSNLATLTLLSTYVLGLMLAPTITEVISKLQSDVIRIEVPGNAYQVHQDILIALSHYFKGMWTSGFLNPRTPVKLDWRPEFVFDGAFGTTMEFMYSRDFRRPEGLTQQDECIHAAYVYVLADYLQIQELQDQALENFRERLLVRAVTYDSWGQATRIGTARAVRLDASAVITLQQVLYENPFDIAPRANVEASLYQALDMRSIAESGSGPESHDVQSQTCREEATEAPAEPSPNVRHNDARDPARKAFVECIVDDLQRLLQDKRCSDLFYCGGDFVLDILGSKAMSA